MLDPEVKKRINSWLEGSYDEETKATVRQLAESDPKEITDSFYRDLEFGTGGLRGIMGVGTNRMNKYTVARATQGFANYLKKKYAGRDEVKAAISCDSRNNSPYFARITAEVLAANGLKVYLFEDLRPTPELSFAVRHLGCQAGIMITASHNPKEYNGYKVYGNDGSQLVSPDDNMVIDEAMAIRSNDEIRFSGNPENITLIGKEIDEAYLDMLTTLSLRPEIIGQQHDLTIVYSALHGTGRDLVPAALKRFGFTNVHRVEEQMIADGNFPTVKSPNPEEKAAMQMALNLAAELDADILMATDPDADRVGIGVKDDAGEFILLNGNQAASLLIYYLLSQWKEQGRLDGNQFIAKTIVTSELLKDIAESYGVPSYDVLTGFKYIAEIIRDLEGKKQFIGGGEESYGYLIGDRVRDKDAVAACALLAEAAAWAKSNGRSLYGLLKDIYLEHGFYLEDLVNITLKGKEGAEKIQEMMAGYRENPPQEISGQRVVRIKDYLTQEEKNLTDGTVKPIQLPKSNVIQFFLESGSKITVRPSGTEPKIKFYFGIRDRLKDIGEFGAKNSEMRAQLDSIITSMNLRN